MADPAPEIAQRPFLPSLAMPVAVATKRSGKGALSAMARKVIWVASEKSSGVDECSWFGLGTKEVGFNSS